MHAFKLYDFGRDGNFLDLIRVNCEVGTVRHQQLWSFWLECVSVRTYSFDAKCCGNVRNSTGKLHVCFSGNFLLFCITFCNYFCFSHPRRNHFVTHFPVFIFVPSIKSRDEYFHDKKMWQLYDPKHALRDYSSSNFLIPPRVAWSYKPLHGEHY